MMAQTVAEAFETTSQIAHGLFAMSVVVLSDYLFGEPMLGVVTAILWALVKEFWYDLEYESSDVSGGLAGSIRDFSYYCVGTFVGQVLVVIHAGWMMMRG